MSRTLAHLPDLQLPNHEIEMSEAVSRFALVREQLPDEFRDPVLVESWSNDVWVSAELVLRVCWQGDRQRLLKEHQLLTVLPASVPHASVVASGSTSDLTWMLLRRISGERLDLVWSRLLLDSRRDAVIALGRVLRDLHRWVPPLQIRKSLLQPTLSTDSSPRAVCGATIVPLPVERVVLLLDVLEGMPGMNEALLRRARARINKLSLVVPATEFRDGPVVHGDAHLANALWFEGHLSALLDFEWARIGPPDLELEAACREDPVIEDAETPDPVSASDVPMLVWLRAGYPELFDRDDLTERLWLYDLCYQIRRLSSPRINTLDDSVLRRLDTLARRPRVRFE